MCFSMQTRVCLFVENAFSRRFFKSNWIWLFITARTQRFNILFLVASIYLFWRQSFRFTFFVALDLCVIAVRRKQIDSIEGDDLLHSNKRRLGLHTVSEWCWVPNAQAKSARFSFSLKCNLRFKPYARWWKEIAVVDVAAAIGSNKSISFSQVFFLGAMSPPAVVTHTFYPLTYFSCKIGLALIEII